MKIEDLMVGDLLYGQPGNKIVRVIELNENDIVCNQRCYDLEPIPITPEILEKNGFVKDELYELLVPEILRMAYSFEYHRLYLFYRENPDGDLKSMITILHYVHELQHALKLCKIDKEIKL